MAPSLGITLLKIHVQLESFNGYERLNILYFESHTFLF